MRTYVSLQGGYDVFGSFGDSDCLGVLQTS